MNNQFVIQAGDKLLTFNQVPISRGEEITKPFYSIAKHSLQYYTNQEDYSKAIQLAQNLPEYQSYLEKPIGNFLEYLDKNSFQKELKAFLNKHGLKKFRKFYINKYLKSKGLYAYKVKDELVYFGRCCDNFNERINKGYGRLEPYNCMHKGQPTNCRLNNEVFVNWKDLSFYICALDEFDTDTIEYYEAQLLNQGKKPIWNKNKPNLNNFKIEEDGTIINLNPKKIKSGKIIQKKQSDLVKRFRIVAKNGEFYFQRNPGVKFSFRTKEGDIFVKRIPAKEDEGTMFWRLKEALRTLQNEQNDLKPFPLFNVSDNTTFVLPDFEFEFKPLNKINKKMKENSNIKQKEFKAEDCTFYLQHDNKAKTKYIFLNEDKEPKEIVSGEKPFNILHRLAIYLYGAYTINNIPKPSLNNVNLGGRIMKFNSEDGNLNLPGFYFKQK